jgi:DNA topoisomerase-1
VPSDKGRLVTAFLESFFKRYVEYDFTAGLEEKLDLISNSELDWKEVLRDFWKDFTTAVAGTKELRTTEVLDALNEVLGPHIFPARADGGDPRQCPTCGTGRLSIKTGKFGAFIGCSNYPECRYTRPFAGEGSGEDGANSVEGGTRVLGTDPATGLEVTLRDGRFGPYVQLGAGDKPKRSSLPKGWLASAMDLEKALRLLSLPRVVGNHPEDGKPISAGLGRYGPFLEHGGRYANLASIDEVFEVGLNRAVTVLAEKKERGGRGGRSEGRVLGEHPEGGQVAVFAGRFGPYVKHGKINATIPKDLDAETITLEQALPLIAARAAAPARTVRKSPAKTKAKAKPKAVAKAKAKPAAKSASKTS